MNLECKVSPLSTVDRLKAIEAGQTDLEYWTPCDLAPLLARGLVARVEAPFGGYYLEITHDGFVLLAAAERLEDSGEII